VLSEGAGCVVLEEYENMLGDVAQKIYAELVAMGCPAMLTISLRQLPMEMALRCMMAPFAELGFRLPISITSMLTAHRRRSATKLNSQQCVGSSAMARPD